MLNFAKYRYNPAMVDACRVTEENLAELRAIIGTTKIKSKPKVGEWVIKKESGVYEIWQNKAFEKKFAKEPALDIVTPSSPVAETTVTVS